MSDDWMGHVRALLYTVQFESDLLEGVEHAIDTIVRGGALGASPARYLASVRTALASSARLSELVVMHRHSEGDVRKFLAEVESRLDGGAGVA